MLGSPDNGVPVLKTAEARRRRVVMPLLIACVIGVLALLLAGSGSQSKVVGAGSTLAQPLIESSAAQFRNAASADNPDRPALTGGDWALDGSGIDYEPVGSLGGVMRLSDPEVDFAVTDYPLSKDALDKLGAAQFPVAVGSVAVVHHLPDGATGGRPLRFDADTLARIYLGTITRWDDPALAALNPGVDLPDLAITPLHRTDGSGSTFGFTRYLADGAPAWASGPGTNSVVVWPAGVGAGAERSAGILQAVKGTPGALGYLEQGQAARAGLSIAHLKNATGGFTGPTPQSMAAAIAGADFSGADGYVSPVVAAKDAARAYPMTVGIYAVLERDPRFKRDTSRALGYLGYLMGRYDASASDLGYLPLPEPAAAAVQAYVARTFSSGR